MKLLLINPSKYDENGKLMTFKYGTFPPFNLLYLASLIKDYKQVEVKIIDEFIEDVPFEEYFDLVGITTLFTSTFPRVIDISNKFRKKGIPVILGGTHATCTFKNSLKYADSIVVGEAEYIFPQLIDDFLTMKKLKKIYKNENFIDLGKLPLTIPRYDLVDLNKYFKVGIIKKSNSFQIETSRGCPMQCTFCSVRVLHGLKPRFKTISSVINEIRFLKKRYNSNCFQISDDNFLANAQRSKNLLKELTKENIRFNCEFSTRILDKPDLIPLLKKAGCLSALIGIESINTDNLKFIKKTHNKVEEYKQLFSLLDKHDITALPVLMFGFDHDDINTFQNVFNFLKKLNVQRASFAILTPFPGTELHRIFKKEKRIINNNLSLYDCSYVVFQPRKLTVKQLQSKYWKLFKKYYGIREIFKRLIKSKKNEFIYSLVANFRFRNLVYRNIFPYNSGIKRIN